MQDSLGFVNPVYGPVLERITREERLNRDNPRRNREEKPKSDGQAAIRETGNEVESVPGETPGNHIDLRI